MCLREMHCQSVYGGQVSRLKPTTRQEARFRYVSRKWGSCPRYLAKNAPYKRDLDCGESRSSLLNSHARSIDHAPERGFYRGKQSHIIPDQE